MLSKRWKVHYSRIATAITKQESWKSRRDKSCKNGIRKLYLDLRITSSYCISCLLPRPWPFRPSAPISSPLSSSPASFATLPHTHHSPRSPPSFITQPTNTPPQPLRRPLHHNNMPRTRPPDPLNPSHFRQQRQIPIFDQDFAQHGVVAFLARGEPGGGVVCGV